MKISIVIPTRNRAIILEKTLRTLLLQLKNNDEVIVVDDHSEDQTMQLVKKFRINKQIVYLKSPGHGSSAARNCGFKSVKNEIVVFLDDDCIVQAGWRKNIEENVRKTVKNDVLFQGKITNTFSKRSLLTPIFEARNKLAWQRITGSSSWGKKQIPYLNAGNIYFHRQTVSGLGTLFDSHVFPYIGEETDLAYRVQLAGKSIKFTPNVEVIHHKTSATIPQMFKNAFILGRVEGLLEQKYLVKKSIKRLFAKEIKPISKVPNQFVLSLKIIESIKDTHLLATILFIPYLFMRDLVYYVGKILARFSN